MEFKMTEEQEMVRETSRQIAEEKIRPVAAEYDESCHFPWDIMKIIADADLSGVYIDEKYGGLGLGTLGFCIAIEELSWGCAGISIGFAATV